MTPNTLRLTRAVLNGAAAVTGFIVKHSAKITTAAAIVHKWALARSIALADKQAEKAWTTYLVAADNSFAHIAMAQKLNDEARADWCAARDKAEQHFNAAHAELTLLGGR